MFSIFDSIGVVKIDFSSFFYKYAIPSVLIIRLFYIEYILIS